MSAARFAIGLRGERIEYRGEKIDEFGERLARHIYGDRRRQSGELAITHPGEMASNGRQLFRPDYEDLPATIAALWCHDIVEETPKVRVFNPYGGHKTKDGQYINDLFPRFGLTRESGQARDGRHFCYMVDRLTLSGNYYEQMRGIYIIDDKNPRVIKGILQNPETQGGRGAIRKAIPEAFAAAILETFAPGFGRRYRNMNIAVACSKTLDRKSNTKKDEQRDTSSAQSRYSEIEGGKMKDLIDFYMDLGVFDYFDASGDFSYNPLKLDVALKYKFEAKKFANAWDNITHYVPLAEAFMDSVEDDNEVFDKNAMVGMLDGMHGESTGILEDTIRLMQEDPRAESIIFYGLADIGANRGRSIKGTRLRRYIENLVSQAREKRTYPSGQAFPAPQKNDSSAADV